MAVVYALLARIGLLLDPVGGFATVVWAPTGIAIAAVMLRGFGVAPGVWIGAFAANLASGAPAVVAGVIALGNSLEALTAVAALRRLRSFDRSLERVNDVLLFAGVAALLAPLASASIGVAALYVADVVSGTEIGRTWIAWWVGDAIGALIVAPFLLAWAAPREPHWFSRRREGMALLVATALVAHVVFFADAPLQGSSNVQAYLVFPLLIWSALRFTQRGAATAILVTCVIAVIATARGSGPFVLPSMQDSLFALQTFMGIVAFSVLLLAAAVAERERALRVAAEAGVAAADANRVKSDFLASMSHELRTPLNAIAGYAQILDMNVHGSLSPEQRDAVLRIEANQRHLASLVEDVLSFTGIEAGQLRVHSAAVPVADVLRTLRSFVEPQSARKNISLSVAAVDPGVLVQADPDRLRQILVNVVTNAVKYSEADGFIAVDVDASADQVRFTVRDNGIGIPSELLPRVFEPFFQVDHGHARRYPGVGLGLTISRDLARAMSGDVAIASQLGQGTIVTVTLPRAFSAGGTQG